MEDVMFKLNHELDVSNKGHILYLYENPAFYIANACEYIETAIRLGQSVLMIDTDLNWQEIGERLLRRGIDVREHDVHFSESTAFYRLNETFSCDAIVEHFKQSISGFQLNGRAIRTWANVKWLNQENMFKELLHYEDEADHAVNHLEMISVCAYDVEVLLAKNAIKLKRVHEYVMTDKEFFTSDLYMYSGKHVIFPSLSEQQQIQSEMDLYKQKLDFAHVVSHEVRNPLTVIKAYCSLMLHDSASLPEEVAYRLSEIKDYVDIIDQELTLIIHTEQMLSSEQLWKKDWIDPLPIIHEVIHFMTIKAKSQNQHLEAVVDVPVPVKMFASKVGLKLIVSNLLSNAIKYNEEGKAVRFDVRRDGGALNLRFEDQGSGMSTEHLENLYVKYSKLNHDKGGQGIGLYMVKQLLDDTGGTIHFESAVGVGTVVEVRMAVEEQVEGNMNR